MNFNFVVNFQNMFWLQIRSDFGQFYDQGRELKPTTLGLFICLKLSKMLELTADDAEGAHWRAVWAGRGRKAHKGHTFAQQSSIPRLRILLEVLRRLANYGAKFGPNSHQQRGEQSGFNGCG